MVVAAKYRESQFPCVCREEASGATVPKSAPDNELTQSSMIVVNSCLSCGSFLSFKGLAISTRTPARNSL